MCEDPTGAKRPTPGDPPPLNYAELSELVLIVRYDMYQLQRIGSSELNGMIQRRAQILTRLEQLCTQAWNRENPLP